MIVLGIPTLNRFDLLVPCVASAYAGSVPPDRVLIIDNSGGACPPIANAEIITGRQPQSVARAWNDAVSRAGTDLILSNDDIAFAPDTIAQLLAVAAAQPRAGIVSAIAGQRFSLFWLRYAAFLDVGPFDEQFWPAYFEDNDYHRRLALAGWASPVAPSLVGHVTSATLAAARPAEQAAHHDRFRANRRRYLAKWGGLPGEETFTAPYDGATLYDLARSAGRV